MLKHIHNYATNSGMPSRMTKLHIRTKDAYGPLSGAIVDYRCGMNIFQHQSLIETLFFHMNTKTRDAQGE